MLNRPYRPRKRINLLINDNSARNRSVWGLIWSGVDGLVRRGASSVLALLLAVVADPGKVGFYSACFIVLTLYQGWFEGPVRQASQRLFRDPEGRSYLHSLVRRGGVIGAIVIIVGVLGIGIYFGSPASDLTPMIFISLVPLLSSASMMRIIVVQRQGQWGRLANYRLIASLSALLLAVPTLLLTGSLWAVPIQAVVAEAIPLLLLRRVLVTRTEIEVPSTASKESRSHVWQSVGPQIFGWIRVQTDRVILIVLGAASTLGVYSMALSVARVPLEAAMQGFVNHLRTELATNPYEAEHGRRVLYSFHKRSYLVSISYMAIVVLLGIPLLKLFLSKEWHAIYPAISVLAVSAIPLVHSTGLMNTLIHFGRHKKIYPTQTIGIILAVVGGVVLSWDLYVGAWIFVLREAVVAVALTFVGRDFVTRRGLALLIAYVLAGVLISFISFLS